MSMRKTILHAKGYFILSLLGSFCALALIAAWPGFMSASIYFLMEAFKVDNLLGKFLIFLLDLRALQFIHQYALFHHMLLSASFSFWAGL